MHVLIYNMPPAEELLVNKQGPDSLWPEEIKNSPELKAQAEMRRNLAARIDSLFQKIPQAVMNVSEAIDSGLVDPEDATLLYTALADFLEADTRHTRIILYLPFELLCDSAWQAPSETLSLSIARFTNCYRKKWRELLTQNDVRANFVDGDIPEQELRSGPPPRVRKAAHLIPKLAEKGLISIPDVIHMMEDSHNDVLNESIADALPVLADTSLLPRAEWKRMLLSSDQKILGNAYATVHGLQPGDQLDTMERRHLFALLDPLSWDHMNVEEIYVSLENTLKAASEMMTRNVISHADAARISEAMIAATRFWSMNYRLTQIVLDLTLALPENPAAEAIRNYETFRRYSDSPQTLAWINRWGKKFLDALGDKGADHHGEANESNEVMSPEQAWERILAARESRKKIAGPTDADSADADEGSREWRHRLLANAEQELRDLKRQYAPGQTARISNARAMWLLREQGDTCITKYSHMIAAALGRGSLSPDDAREFVMSGNGSTSALIAIRGIGAVVETLAKDDQEKANAMRRQYDTMLHDLWRQDNPEINDALIRTWSCLLNLGVIDRAPLNQLGVQLPNLDAWRVADDASAVEKQIQEFKPVIRSLESDPECARFLYPLCIFFGSRIKGYPTWNADLDVAILVRPDISITEQPKLKQILSRVFSHEKIGGKVVEFWLAADGDDLEVQNFPFPDSTLADSTWVHVLFGGVWYGNQEAIQEMYKKLLPGYLFSHNKKIKGHDARSIWLEEMEREVLQYRLMHKGYSRYHPEQGGIHTPHAKTIDSQSAFWDSGYRRVATKLFIGRVFLPQLEKRGVQKNEE